MGLSHSPKIVTDGLVLALDAGNQKSLPVSSSSTFSNYFDGSSDWLNVGASSATQLTGDFTVEAWVWIDSTVVASRPDNFKTVSLFSSGGATSGTCLFCISGNTSTAGIGLEIYQDSPFSALGITASFPLDQWAHVAFVRTGSTVYGFINGTRYTFSVLAGSATVTYGSSSSGSRIGSILNSTYYGYWKGYISNLRVLKGTALYTSNFTPSTTPFTAITNTSLLTCQSATFIDNSTNNLSITTNGNVTAQAATLTFFNASVWTDLSGNGNNGTLTNGPTYNNSNGGSIVFDGSNDFVNCGTGIALVSSWSIAVFVNYTNSSGADVLIGRTGDSSTGFAQNYVLYSNSNRKFVCQTSVDSFKTAVGTTTLQFNTWYYVVGTYNSTTKILSVYVNGQLEGSSTTLSVNPPTTGTQYVTLGAGDGLVAANPFQGKIAFGQIYNRELTATEILQNFNALRGRFSI